MATRSTSAASTVLVSPTTVLRLRADVQPTAEATRRIQWTEDVVDNEHLGKRKSKRRYTQNFTRASEYCTCNPACMKLISLNCCRVLYLPQTKKFWRGKFKL